MGENEINMMRTIDNQDDVTLYPSMQTSMKEKETQEINIKYENQRKKLKALHHEINELKIKLQREINNKEKAFEKIEKLEEKHKNLEEEIQILRSLNYDLQRKCIATAANKTATPTHESDRTPVSSPIEDPSLHIEDQAVNNNKETTQPFILFQEVRFFKIFTRQYTNAFYLITY